MRLRTILSLADCAKAIDHGARDQVFGRLFTRLGDLLENFPGRVIENEGDGVGALDPFEADLVFVFGIHGHLPLLLAKRKTTASLLNWRGWFRRLGGSLFSGGLICFLLPGRIGTVPHEIV